VNVKNYLYVDRSALLTTHSVETVKRRLERSCSENCTDCDAVISRPVLIEVPHFASLRGNEREITILRSDNGQTWREHSTVATEEAVHEAMEGSFSGQHSVCAI